jgi:hypothetical protein
MSGRSVAILLTLAAVATAIGAWWLRRPSHDRRWAGDQAVLPAVRFEGTLAHVTGVRDFSYASETEWTAAWRDRTYDLDRLEAVWLVLVPLSRAWRGPAHSFVTFGFDDGTYAAISIEARRQAGETYNPVWGLFRRYELIYVIGEEPDLIGRRAIHDGDPVYLFPIRAEKAAIRTLFVEMLTRAERIRQAPEFYNTLTDNCTNLLLRHVETAAPGRVQGGIAGVLPGYADTVALELGLVEGATTVAEARRKYRINDRAKAAEHAPDFSRRIRAATD